VAFTVRHCLPLQTAGEFGEQPGLAQPGFPHDADHLSLPIDRLRQPRVEHRQFLGAAHKVTQRPGPAPGDARPPPLEVADRVHRHRRGQRLEREGIAHLTLHFILHQRIGSGADQDSGRRGLLLEPGCHMEGGTRRVGPLQRVRQRSHHHWPAVQPQTERHAGRLLPQRLEGVPALAQIEGCQHSPAGMILLRSRCPKQRQEALVRDLEEGALIALHRLLGERQHIAHEVVHGLRPQPHRQGQHLG
jgi:hypothetical protein